LLALEDCVEQMKKTALTIFLVFTPSPIVVFESHTKLTSPVKSTQKTDFNYSCMNFSPMN